MYDNGIIDINGYGFRDTPTKSMIGATRQIMQILEELASQAAKRVKRG
jgi:hypothetical protein